MKPLDIFKLLANDLRLRIICMTAEFGEVCVCEFSEVLGVSQPKVSRHLALLRENEFLITKKVGTWIYYQVNPQLSQWMQGLINDTLNNSKTIAPFKTDINKLQKIRQKQLCETN